MSEIRRTIEEKGEADRQIWDPDPNSAHLRAYRWWQEASGKSVLNENFCHYWRVVLIWAPLRWMYKKFFKPLMALLVLAVVALLAWLFISFTGPVLGALFVAGVVLYVAAGLAVTKQTIRDLGNVLDVKPVPWLGDLPPALRLVAVVLTLPVVAVFGGVLCVVLGLIALIIWTHEEHNYFRRSGRWLFMKKMSDNPPASWLRPWLAVPVAVVALALAFPAVRPVAYTLLAVALFIGVLAGIILGFAFFVDWLKHRKELKVKLEREAREKRHIDLALNFVFQAIHPKHAGDAERYDKWRLRYDKYVLSTYDRDVYSLSAYWHIGRLPERFSYSTERAFENKLFVDSLPATKQVKPRRPSVIKKFFRIVGEYLALIWVVVKVKKWKICPWVKIPS